MIFHIFSPFSSVYFIPNVERTKLLLPLRVLEFEGEKKKIAIELCQIFFWFYIILEI